MWIYQGKHISLKKENNHEIVVHPGGVVIIPVADDKELYFVKQWREGIKKTIFELPAGTLEKNEDPAVCAQRELQEEIGFKAHTLLSFGGFFTTPGFCNEYLYLFLGKDLEISVLKAEDDEKIEVVKMSLKTALDLIDSGQIEDNKTITGILKYDRWLKTAS